MLTGASLACDAPSLIWTPQEHPATPSGPTPEHVARWEARSEEVRLSPGFDD